MPSIVLFLEPPIQIGEVEVIVMSGILSPSHSVWLPPISCVFFMIIYGVSELASGSFGSDGGFERIDNVSSFWTRLYLDYFFITVR